MSQFSESVKMDSKQGFYKTIYSFYAEIVGKKITPDLLEKMCERVTDYYYEQYNRFRKQYPKSLKRYSAFQIKDLDHPETKEIIVNFFKANAEDDYSKYSMIVLEMTFEELQSFEKNREDFHNMF